MTDEHALGDLVAAIMRREDEAFLGTTFSINHEERLFLAAAHTISIGELSSLRIVGVADGRLVEIAVEETEHLEGQRDVLVLRAAKGLPSFAKLAYVPATVWQEIFAAGFPEHDIRKTDEGVKELFIRGLRGAVTRRVRPGDALGVTDWSYEVSFAIPAGMSGGPVLVRVGSAYGVVGVCLGNNETQSVLWQVEREEVSGHSRVQEAQRIIEYGLVAMLHKSELSTIAMTGATLRDTMGLEIHAGLDFGRFWQQQAPPESDPGHQDQ